MPIELPEATVSRAVASIRRYFKEELDQPIGDLKARMLLDFLLAEIGPSIHNRAIEQAQAALRERVSDLESMLGQEEFGHWPRSTGRGRA
jgi:uncharacterized protein (DUF2164 family)